jgi:hypothetical protein
MGVIVLERIGRVCGWTGDRLTILFFIGAFVALILGDDARIDDAVSVGIAGVIAFLIGWAIRCVLVPPLEGQVLCD